MSDKILCDTSDLTPIANAVREATGESKAYSVIELGSKATELILNGGSNADEIIKHAEIPDYVKTEALRVAQQVQSVRQDDSIVFLAMSDSHHYGEQKNTDQYPNANGIQTDTSNLHAAMAAKILAYALKFDFMAQLGDITWGAQKTTSALLHSQVDELLSFLRESHNGIPCFHAIGNHDSGIYYHNQQITDGKTGIFTESGEWLYNHFTALSASDNTVFGGQVNGGYCYRDFPDKKLRVFLLNTSESLVTNQTDKATLSSQRKWFADALVNLNSKTDAADWQWMLLSHYPADYGNTMPLSELLKAYVEGKSITITLESGSNATINFSGKNSAKMIAQFHGHTHNFLTSKLYTYQSGAGMKYDAWRVCIPNGQFNRENYYTTAGNYTDISFAQDTTYSKTAGSAKDTSFVVNVINPSEQIIHSICYGAGYDRVISYGATVYYSVLSNLTNVRLSNAIGNVAEGDSYISEIIPDEHCAITNIIITMGGTDITQSVYSNGTITIPEVAGDIVITASAELALACTNQIPISTNSDGSIYNEIGYKNKSYIQANGNIGVGDSYVTGFIPVQIGDVIRLANMSFNATDGNRFVFYDSNYNYLYHAVGLSSYFFGTQWPTIVDANGNFIQVTLNDTAEINGAAYIRIQTTNLTKNSIVTVNEKIRYMDELEGSYVVINNLTNANSSNLVSTVAGGAAYTTTIVAVDGCELQKVVVTMDGVDITSTVYANGIINIPMVVGNISITVTAGKIATYTNQIPISTDADGNTYNGIGYKKGIYLSSGNESSRSSSFVTGFIPCGTYPNYTVYMKNVTFDSDASDKTYHRIAIYDANKQHLVTITASSTASAYGTVVDGNGVWTQFQFRQTTANVDVKNMAYFRLCCSYIGTDSIITVNEEIT